MTAAREFHRRASTRLLGALVVLAGVIAVYTTLGAREPPARWLLWLEIGALGLALCEVVWKWRTPAVSLMPWGLSWSQGVLRTHDIAFAAVARWQVAPRKILFADHAGRAISVDLSDLDDEARAELVAALEAHLGPAAAAAE